MTNSYLVYLFDPIAPDKQMRYFLFSGRSRIREVTSKDLDRITDNLVTFEVATLLDSERNHASNWIDRLVDVDVGLCLAAGMPKDIDGQVSFRSFMQVLKADESEELRPYIHYCFNACRSTPESDLNKSLTFVAKRLQKCWIQLERELKAKGELRRFVEVEVPVSRILFKRQLEGIRVDCDVLARHLKESAESTCEAKERLRSLYGLIDPGNIDLVKRVIQNDLMLSEVMASNEPNWQIDGLLKLYSKKNELARWLRQYRKNDRSRKILLRIGSDLDGRVHPDFACVGTVTGRVLVQNPLLQNLAKEYRDVLSAEDDKILLYPDYCQCEPGIMAHDSADQQFQEDYNSGDVYAVLASKLLGSGKDARETAKLLFLFYCYGMNKDRIAENACNLFGLGLKKAKTTMDGFFGRYTELESWRYSLRLQIKRDKRISTVLGNYRYLSDNDSPDLNLRGAQSQRIQGTAALILKQSMIAIAKALPDVGILLPMHDALLLQVPAKTEKVIRREVAEIMVACYKKICPSIMPRVSFNSFYSVKSEM